MPGVVGQGGLHGADHVGQGVEADHVGGAVGGALGAADQRAGEGVDFVEAEAEARGVVHHRQDREHADAVGDEVGGVLGADDALAEPGGEPGFEVVEHGRLGAGGGDQLDQRHVAWRVEEVDAAEAVAQGLGQAGVEGGDRQPRGVGGEDRVRTDEGRDLGVEVELPLQLLGDGLDDEVAATQLFEVAAVVGHVDELGPVFGGEGRRVELLEAVHGLAGDAAGVALLRRQVEQDHRHAGIGAVGGDLRPHHAGAQHRHLANDQSAHAFLLCLWPGGPGCLQPGTTPSLPEHRPRQAVIALKATRGRPGLPCPARGRARRSPALGALRTPSSTGRRGSTRGRRKHP